MPISLPLEDTFSAAGGTCDTGQGRIVTGTVGYHLGRAVLSDGSAVAYGPFAPAAGLAAVVHSGAWQTQAVDRFQPSVQGGTSGVVRQAGLALLMEPNGGLGAAVGLNDVASGINQVIPGIDPTGHVHAFALTGKDLITGVVLLGGPPGARAVGGYPDVRPVGVSGYALPADSYLVLNASGGTVEAHDVRIRGDAYADWLGPAHAGQDFRGGSGGLTTDARGLSWAVSGGGTFALGSSGLSNNAQTVRAVVTPASPSGLIAYYVKHLANPVYYRLIFRHQDANNYWYVGVRWDWFLDIGYVSGGVDNQLQTTGANVPGANVERLMQINDDGSKIVVTWAGATIFEIDNATHAAAKGVGIQMEGDGTGGHTLLQMMLAYPRAVTLPTALRPASTPFSAQGSTLVDEDTFAGAAAHIAGRALTTGGKSWAKNAGAQNVNTDGAGKAVPSAALTTALIYSVPWANPDFIDVEFAWDLNSTYSRGGVLLAQSLTPGAETYLAAAVFRDPSQPGTDEIELRAVVNGAGGGNRIYPVQLGTRMGSVVTGRMTYDRALDRGALWLDGVPVMEFSWRMVSDGSTTPPSVNYWGLYNDQPNNGGAWDYARARAAQQTHALALQSGTLTPSGPSLALSQGHALAPQSGSLSLSAPSAVLSQAHALGAGPGSLALEGAALALSQTLSLSVQSATLTPSAPALGLSQTHTLAFQSAALSLSSTDLAISQGGEILLALQSGTLGLQAPALSLSQSHALAAPAASLEAAGSALALSQTHGLAFQAATLTPSAPALTLSQTHPLAFHSGTLSFSGGALALSQTHALAAPAASLGLAGAAIALNLSHALAVTPGVQALTGAALALQQSHSLALAPGVLSLEGTPAAVYSQTLEGSSFRAVPERPRYRAGPERPKYLARKE